MPIPRLLLVPAALLAAACATPAGPPADVATAIRVAQEYVDGYYHQFPEEAYEIGYPDTPMDSLGDRGQAAMDAWRAREDAWLAALRALAPLAKARLVQSLFAAATADGTIRLGEAELLRLVGAVLDCPLPPLVDALAPVEA